MPTIAAPTERCSDKTNHTSHYWWRTDSDEEMFCEGYYLSAYTGSYGDDNDDGYY